MTPEREDTLRNLARRVRAISCVGTTMNRLNAFFCRQAADAIDDLLVELLLLRATANTVVGDTELEAKTFSKPQDL